MKKYLALSMAALILIAALGGGAEAARRSRYVAYGRDGVVQAAAPAAQTPLLPGWIKTAAGLAPPPFGNLYWLLRASAEKIRELRENEDLEFPVVIGLRCRFEQVAVKHGHLRHVQQQEVAMFAGRFLIPCAL